MQSLPAHSRTRRRSSEVSSSAAERRVGHSGATSGSGGASGACHVQANLAPRRSMRRRESASGRAAFSRSRSAAGGARRAATAEKMR